MKYTPWSWIAQASWNEHFEVAWVYTQATSKCRIQLELETPLGEALVEENSYSIVKINNDG